MIINLKVIRKFIKPLIIAAAAVLAVFTVYIIFQTRSPVLIVAEEAFVVLYGKQRIKDDILANSKALFRKVEMVIVANDASDDIIPHAISEISLKPYCVLFPMRFFRPARLYREQNPDIPIVILDGRSVRNSSEFDYIYKTDIENDFKKAGLAAFQIGNGGKIAVFLESSIDSKAREAFLSGIGEEMVPEVSFYTNFSLFNQNTELSCAVLAGIGNEFFEGSTYAHIPVIYMSWLDPGYIPSNVVMVINDSPLAQVREVVRLFSAGEKEGKIGSKFLVLNSGVTDKKIFRKIQKIR